MPGGAVWIGLCIRVQNQIVCKRLNTIEAVSVNKIGKAAVLEKVIWEMIENGETVCTGCKDCVKD